MARRTALVENSVHVRIAYVLNLTQSLPLTRSRSLALALTRARSLALALARAPRAQFLLSIAFISAWHTYGYFVSSGDAPT